MVCLINACLQVSFAGGNVFSLEERRVVVLFNCYAFFPIIAQETMGNFSNLRYVAVMLPKFLKKLVS